jgi:hypothetical protein
LRTPITIEEEQLAQAFLTSYSDSIYGTVSRQGFELGSRKALSYTLFATENPTILFLEFSMAYDCTDIRGEGRTDGILLLSGDGSYIPSNGQFSDIRNFGEHLKWRTADGNEGESRNVVIFAAGIVLGHKEVTNVVRYKLSD